MTGAEQLAAWLAWAAVLAYAVWTARDVILKRQRSDERMEKLESTCKRAIENMAKEMAEAIPPLEQRLKVLEGAKGGQQIAAAQGWRAPR